ncbi:hypothetical protein QUF80_12815 [Desulfococcaceae bacterium HSG8]|nr:hypothetical protein [Desulfococcaceae bacterium HSG8]
MSILLCRYRKAARIGHAKLLIVTTPSAIITETIVGVIHNKQVYPNPDINYRFAEGDFVAVMGDKFQIKCFKELV